MKTPCLLLLSLMFATLGAHAQKFVTEDNEWGNLDLNGLRVGTGTHVLKTDYGK